MRPALPCEALARDSEQRQPPMAPETSSVRNGGVSPPGLPPRSKSRGSVGSGCSLSEANCITKVFCCLLWSLKRTYRIFGIQEEGTGFFMHHCCLFARLAILISHGQLMYSIASVERPAEVHLSSVFRPVWFGDSIACVFIVCSWFASCPYIVHSVREREPPALLAGPPRLLLDLFPGIVLAVLALPCMFVVIVSEYALSVYIETVTQPGVSGGLAPIYVVTLLVCSMMAVLRGALLEHSSSFYLLFGNALLVTTLVLAVLPTRSPRTNVLALAPHIVACLGLAVAMALRSVRYARVLSNAEIGLRSAQIGLLLLMGFNVGSATYIAESAGQKQKMSEWSQARSAFAMLGGCLYCSSVIVLCLSCFEVRRGTLEQRYLENELAESCGLPSRRHTTSSGVQRDVPGDLQLSLAESGALPPELP